jgi:hypothetical protein
MSTKPRMSLKELNKVAAELAENAALLEPKLSAEILTERLVGEADSKFLAELGRTLLIGFFSRLIRSTRARLARRL